MKKLFADTPDVPQGVANRAVRIIEKHLRQHKVDRAKDLPEEAKIRLLRDLRFFFESEMGDGGLGSGSMKRGFWVNFWEKIENFMNFSSTRREMLDMMSVFGIVRPHTEGAGNNPGAPNQTAPQDTQ